jgi:aflatoxin B1 aldehyde reductase
VKAFLHAFYGRGYRKIDTAQNYPGSEERLGNAGAGTRFLIGTKVKTSAPGDHEPAKIELSIKDSLDKLRVPSVDILYLHRPDRQTPFEDTAKAMNDAFAQGKFKKLGLSNYSAEEVRKYIAICEEKGYVKPSVYQGHYNAIVRGGEDELFPLLREKNIAFYAYR